MLGLLEILALNIFDNIVIDKRIGVFLISLTFIFNYILIPLLEEQIFSIDYDVNVDVMDEFSRILDVYNDMSAIPSLERDSCIAKSETISLVCFNETVYCGKLNPTGLFSMEYHSALAAKNQTITRILEKIRVKFSTKSDDDNESLRTRTISRLILSYCEGVAVAVDGVIRRMSEELPSNLFCVNRIDESVHFDIQKYTLHFSN